MPRERSTGISVPSRTTYACPVFFASRTALRSFGARADGSATVSVTYRQAVEVPTPEPGRDLGERVALAQVDQD